jgi:hypothetical protein
MSLKRVAPHLDGAAAAVPTATDERHAVFNLMINIRLALLLRYVVPLGEQLRPPSHGACAVAIGILPI